MQIEIDEEMIGILRRAVLQAQNTCEFSIDWAELEKALDFLTDIEVE